MAKHRKRRTHRTAVVRHTPHKVRRVYRRIGDRGGMMAGLIPDTSSLMNAAIGGAGYAAARGAVRKFLPSLSDTVGGLIAAFVVHVAGNKFMGRRDVGVAALGALAAEVTISSGVLEQIGLSDYYADGPTYFDGNVVHLGVPGGSVGLPAGTGIHDPGRVASRMHDGRDYGSSYGTM